MAGNAVLRARHLRALVVTLGVSALSVGAVAAPRAAAPRAAAPQAGVPVRLEICRMRGVEDAYAAKPIDIPAGAAFDDLATLDDPLRFGDPEHAVAATVARVVTTAPARIADQDYCVTAPARLLGGLSAHEISTAAGQLFAPSIVPALHDWPGGRHLVGILHPEPTRS